MLFLRIIVVKNLWHLNLASTIASVGVVLDVDVRLFELALLWKVEADVLDGEPSLEPLHLVVRLYFKNVVGQSTVVKIAGVNLGVKIVKLCKLMGVGVEEWAVGLEVDKPIRHQHFAIVVQETCAGKAFVGVLHLRIGERNPYFVHFSWLKELQSNFSA